MVVLFVLLACVSSVVGSVVTGQSRTSPPLQDFEAIVWNLVDKNSKLEQRLDVLEKENKILQDLFHGKESHIDSILGNPRKRQLLSSRVAFTAIVTPFTVNNMQNGDVVIFDKVLTNVADGYDSNTGIFIAPVAGIYVFNYALMVEPGTREYLQIVKDGQHILNNFAHSSSVSVYSSSSRTVTLDLHQGSKVWIQTPPDFDHGDGSIHGNEYTTFSGWLLSITE